MPQLLGILSIGLLLLATAARARTPPPKTEEPPVASFTIDDVANRADAPPEMSTLAARDGSHEAQALFLIELDNVWVQGKVDGHDGPGPLVFFSKGRFRHVAGTDPKPFLAKLAKALGATAPKTSQDKAEELTFEVGVLGIDLSRDPMGGFNGKPAGTWIAMKLFLANGDAEVYFNFDTATGDAEFSPKDEAYGNLVVEELSKVLW